MKIQIIFIGIVMVCTRPLISETPSANRHLNVVAFSGEPGEAYWAGREIVQSLGVGDFPTRFTRLFLPVPFAGETDLGLAIPKRIAVLDIDEWRISDQPGTGKTRFEAEAERKNKITDLSYRLEFSSTQNPLKVRLKGKWKRKKFDGKDIVVWDNRPTLVGIRLQENEGVFFALRLVRNGFATEPDSTAVAPADELESTPVKAPEIRVRTTPAFPRELRGHSGIVLILAVIRKNGTLDPDRIRAMRSPHTLFLKAFLAEAVKNWRFRPAERNGMPVDFLATIECRFRSE